MPIVNGCWRCFTTITEMKLWIVNHWQSRGRQESIPWQNSPSFTQNFFYRVTATGDIVTVQVESKARPWKRLYQMMKYVEQLPGPCLYKIKCDALGKKRRISESSHSITWTSLSPPFSPLSLHDMASTESTPSDMHGLTASQLSELQGAVQALDNYLLVCVDDLRNKRWDRPNAKVVADRLVRELAVFYFISW